MTSLGGTTFSGSLGIGSGGAIRLIANSIAGTGTIDVRNDGRIRLAANSVSGNVVTLPQTIAVPPASPPTPTPGAAARRASDHVGGELAAAAEPPVPTDANMARSAANSAVRRWEDEGEWEENAA